ncbi:MAG: bifunctional tetrahydrofolate synthase/dihydrofolate synthase [Gammaproteobacteria bacterium]|nr:MAG: bifunctional tetrahydrofolate synthase/dihydrofolate synthase [Gammaproteobacteria bacterium]
MATGQDRFHSLSEWLAWQEGLHVREIDLGLERVREVASRLDLLSPDYHVITVAGTNGKGSCVEMLQAILSAAGYRVGSYTSPHLLHYNERIRVGGEMVTDEALCRAFAEVDRARGETSLTYFEFGTLAALYLFRQAGLDAAVLEVGLGGRLDAVNLLDAEAALVTSIDLDHVEWLGESREEIAREKAGIFRPGAVAVCAEADPPRTLLEEAQRLRTRRLANRLDYHYREAGRRWDFECGEQRLQGLPRPALEGSFQLQNAAAVLALLTGLREVLPVAREAIEQGLREVRLAGRIQRVPGPVELILDVAHNPQAASVLASQLRERPARGRTWCLLGMLRDKDCAGVGQILGPLVDGWHVCTLQATRGAAAPLLADSLRVAGVEGEIAVHESVEQGYRAVLSRARPGDRVVVMGSFLTVGAVLPLISVPVGAAGR